MPDRLLRAGGTSYDSVQDAVYMKGQNGETVKLLRDTSENVFINMDTNVTIDLDGHTITDVGRPTGCCYQQQWYVDHPWWRYSGRHAGNVP